MKDEARFKEKLMENFKYNDNGKLTSLDYQNNDFLITINVNSHCVVKESDPELTGGKVIEEYRKKRKANPENAESFFDQNKSAVDYLIDSLSINHALYDYVQIMLPKDERRREVLQRFSKKHFNEENDYSNNFRKKEDKSIVGLPNKEAFELFEFNKPEIKQPVKTLLIVDDTIDKGTTINIFLENLMKENILDKETKVISCIIYNNFNTSEPKISREDIMKIMLKR
jgi:hypothetical protein